MIDLTELEELINNLTDKSKLKRASSNSLYNASNIIATHSKKNHKFKTRTGQAENSVKIDVQGLSSSIFADTSKAKHVEYLYDGTKDHTIEPKNTKSLSFVVGNNRFFSKGHMVKGIKAEPFIFNSWKSQREKFFKTYAEDLTEQLQENIK